MQNTKNSVCVIGLWHLGSVTASCLASLGIETVGFDFDPDLIKNFNNYITPIYEPKLSEFIKNGIKSQTLKFTSSIEDIKNHKYYWITYDTPLGNNEEADIDSVIRDICNLNEYIKDDSILIISSQIEVGTCDEILKIFRKKYSKKLNIFYVPENLRLGKSIDIFLNPERVVIGHDNKFKKLEVKNLIDKISDKQIWISNKSAEMVKHSINSFLATSVVFANEMASICEKVGANAEEVSSALKFEKRIGKDAYISPGGPFSGGTLARDVLYLNKISKEKRITTPLISSILVSNKNHKDWVLRLIKRDFNKLDDLNILILGLTYKNGTDTLRGSHALEIASKLSKTSGKIYLYDPQINELQYKLQKNIILKKKLLGLENINIIISTRSWNTQLREILKLVKTSKRSLTIYDINRNLFDSLEKFENLNCKYRTIGYSG